jgi:hypothetical protein
VFRGTLQGLIEEDQPTSVENIREAEGNARFCTCLITVGSAYKYHWTLSRNVECTSGSHFSKENLGDDSPKHHCCIVGKRSLCFRSGRGHLEDISEGRLWES